jgi:hypothetical protein
MVTTSGQPHIVTIPIRVSAENHERLAKLSAPGQSFNGVITILLEFWDEKHN